MPRYDGELASTTSGDAQAIIDAAREKRTTNLDLVKPDAASVIAYRTDRGDVELLDVEKYLDRPRRPVGVHRPGDLPSLIALTERLGNSESTTVWVHPTSGVVEVVFDDHDGEPGFGDHRAILKLEKTPAWIAWLSLDGRWLDQADFAEHVESRIPDIASPPAADLQEVITTLTGKVEVNWQSGIRTHDGTVQLAYTEEAQATAGRKQNLEIPQSFTLVVQPFVGLDKRVPITARFRYRIKAGGMRMGYVLDQPEDVLADAVTNVHAQLAEKFDRVYKGQPR